MGGYNYFRCMLDGDGKPKKWCVFAPKKIQDEEK
jgi:hypothetical protein